MIPHISACKAPGALSSTHKEPLHGLQQCSSPRPGCDTGSADLSVHAGERSPDWDGYFTNISWLSCPGLNPRLFTHWRPPSRCATSRKDFRSLLTTCGLETGICTPHPGIAPTPHRYQVSAQNGSALLSLSKGKEKKKTLAKLRAFPSDTRDHVSAHQESLRVQNQSEKRTRLLLSERKAGKQRWQFPPLHRREPTASASD